MFASRTVADQNPNSPVISTAQQYRQHERMGLARR
jgi:hypothetical protein